MAEEKLNPLSLDDFHSYSVKHLPKMVYEYYVSKLIIYVYDNILRYVKK